MKAKLRFILLCAAGTLLLTTSLTGFILDIVLILMAAALAIVALKYIK